MHASVPAVPNVAFGLSAVSVTTALSATSAASAGTATNGLNLSGAPAANLATLAGNQTSAGVLNFAILANTISGIFTGNVAGLLNPAGESIQTGTIPRSAVGSDIESVLSHWTSAPGLPVLEPLDAVGGWHGSPALSLVRSMPPADR